MQDLLNKYQSLTTKQQVLTAILIFVLGIAILPNTLVYGASVFASHKLIQKVSFRWFFVTIFSVATFFSFVLLFADEDIEQQPAVTVQEEQTEVFNDEVTAEVATSTANQTSTTTKAERTESDVLESEQEVSVEQNIAPPQTTTKTPDVPIDTFKVVSVVDGDTIKLDMNGTTETIRLIGIDTPETVHPSKPVECMGMEASNKAKQLLVGQTVRFEGDTSQDTRDRYSRLLGYVFLPDGRNYGDVMIRSGYAYEYTYSSAYKYQSLYKEAQSYAESSKLGLWADGVCEEEVVAEDPTPEPVATPSSDGHKWYVSSHYSSKFYYCEESDAWQGLSETYLEVYDSEAALKAKYPSHTLHESC